jgi:hypothetical protein
MLLPLAMLLSTGVSYVFFNSDKAEVHRALIQPIKPVQNAIVESLNSKY